MRVQVRPRRSQVPRPTSGMRAPWASTTSVLRAIAGTSPALGIVQKAEQKQRPARGLPVLAEGAHGRGHGALEKVPIEVAGPLARVDPGALHQPQLDPLLDVELVAQAAERLVEDVVPDREFGGRAGPLIGGGW